MKKKILLSLSTSALGILAFLCSNVEQVSAASLLEYRVESTTLEMTIYHIDSAGGTPVEIPDRKETYERNSDSSLKVKITYEYDDNEFVKDFVPQGKEIYTLDDRHRPIVKTEYDYNGNQWEECYRYQYTYNDNNQVTSEIYDAILGQNWVHQTGTTYTYYADGLLQEKIEFGYDQGQSYKSNSEEYVYSEGLVTSHKTYHYNNDSKVLDNDITTEYNADRSIKSITNILYQNGNFSQKEVDSYAYQSGCLKSIEKAYYTDEACNNLRVKYLFEYQYNGDEEIVERSDYNKTKGEYEKNSKSFIVNSKTLVVNKMAYYNELNQDWNEPSGFKHVFLYDKNDALTKDSIYSIVSGVEILSQVVKYNDMHSASSSDNGNSKKGGAGAAIGITFGVLVIGFVGLYIVWKKELTEAIENNTVSERKLKVLDVVYTPIDKIIFGDK